ncbi:MAG TPA: hypothetical protein VIK37_00385 [Candidatus Saccharimonadales bacterium]
MRYRERATEFLTPQYAKSLNGAAGLAGWQVQAMQVLGGII